MDWYTTFIAFFLQVYNYMDILYHGVKKQYRLLQTIYQQSNQDPCYYFYTNSYIPVSNHDISCAYNLHPALYVYYPSENRLMYNSTQHIQTYKHDYVGGSITIDENETIDITPWMETFKIIEKSNQRVDPYLFLQCFFIHHAQPVNKEKKYTLFLMDSSLDTSCFVYHHGRLITEK
jgi:hypothetical protein